MQLIPVWDSLPDLAWKEKVAYLTYQFLQLPQTDCPVKEIFEPGLYIRQMVIPSQTIFLGRAHRYGHQCELLSGSLIHIAPDGTRPQVDAPFVMHTTPGYHMVLFALTECVARTYHPNPSENRDGQALENDIFESVEDLKELGSMIHRRLT